MKTTILILALAAPTATSAMAGAFSGLCDTGLASGCASNTPLAANQADGNYTVTSAPAGVGATPYTIVGNPGNYFFSGGNSIGTATSDWISAVTAGPVDTTDVGTFNYQEAITADVTGSVTITGMWGTDNCGTLAWGGTAVSSGSGLTIGGGANASACTSPLSAFGSLTAFSFNETVTAGSTYDLDFNVYNSGSITALLVDSLSATCTVGTTCVGGGTATSEPSSVSLTLTGFALLGGIIIRRSRAGARTCS